MYKTIDCPICEKKIFFSEIGEWSMIIVRVETAVKSYISEYKISKLLSQIRIEANRCYNRMMTPVVGLRSNYVLKKKFFCFLLNNVRKIYLVSLTASRLSGIVCKAISNIFARKTHKKLLLLFF